MGFFACCREIKKKNLHCDGTPKEKALEER
jgi:hypothetical protein